jgi:hypothetical protein
MWKFLAKKSGVMIWILATIGASQARTILAQRNALD